MRQNIRHCGCDASRVKPLPIDVTPDPPPMDVKAPGVKDVGPLMSSQNSVQHSCPALLKPHGVGPQSAHINKWELSRLAAPLGAPSQRATRDGEKKRQVREKRKAKRQVPVWECHIPAFLPSCLSFFLYFFLSLYLSLYLSLSLSFFFFSLSPSISLSLSPSLPPLSLPPSLSLSFSLSLCPSLSISLFDDAGPSSMTLA